MKKCKSINWRNFQIWNSKLWGSLWSKQLVLIIKATLLGCSFVLLFPSLAPTHWCINYRTIFLMKMRKFLFTRWLMFRAPPETHFQLRPCVWWNESAAIWHPANYHKLRESYMCFISAISVPSSLRLFIGIAETPKLDSAPYHLSARLRKRPWNLYLSPLLLFAHCRWVVFVDRWTGVYTRILVV